MNIEKLYVSTTASDAYDIAQEYGLGIEIADFCTAWNIDDDFEKTDRELRLRLGSIERKLLHAPFNELFPCAIDKKARKLAAFRYGQAVRLAGQYGASKVVIHGGYNPYIYYPEWYVEQSVLFWKDFIREVPETIHIALENTLEETPELLLNIVKDVNDPRLKICLDIGHANAYSEKTALEWIERCREFISHFHIHNNDGTRDSHSGLEEGSIPVAELLSLSEKLCPDASYTIETMSAKASVQWITEQNNRS